MVRTGKVVSAAGPYKDRGSEWERERGREWEWGWDGSGFGRPSGTPIPSKNQMRHTTSINHFPRLELVHNHLLGTAASHPTGSLR